MSSEPTTKQWLEALPSETFFRTSHVPGSSRGAVRTFLSREAAKPVPALAMKVAPNLYWKPAPPSSITGKVHGPSWVLIGWEVAGPHAAALGWHGANYVGWSDQIALQYVEFAVPGEPSQRHPHPRVTIRSRKNLQRRELTRLEATYIEAVIGFDRWCEGHWDQALTTTKILLERRAADGEELPRADAIERVASHEWLRRDRDRFRARIQGLVKVMAGCEQRAVAGE